MRVFYLFMAALLAAGFPADTLARTYFLPDYQSEFLYGNRVQDSDSGHHTSTPSCSDYGFYSAPQNNADCQRVSPPAPGLVCYSCKACSADYVYDSSNCSGDYVTSGSTCSGKYNQCICDRSKFPVSSGGCPSGQKIDTANFCKGPSDTETYYQCVDDPCVGLTDNTTDFGCQSYYRQCPSLCEVGKTCVPNDCSEYTLTDCPANASCESCVPGCGNEIPKFRLLQCSDGYLDLDNYWCNGALRIFLKKIKGTLQ